MWPFGKRREEQIAEDRDLFDEEFQRRLESLAIVARRTVDGKTRAERRSKKTGSGIEFADHREYAPGDDFRFVDWKLYGRAGRLLVRLFEEEEDLSVYVLLDVSASMTLGTPRKIDHAKRLAAALAYVSLAGLDRVSLSTFSDRITSRLPPLRGKARVFRVFDFLRRAELERATDLAAAMRQFVASNKRRGVVLLISDLYDPKGFESGIDVLRYARFEPRVLHLVDPRDAAPALHGDVVLVDRETGERRDVTITESVLARYRAAHARYRERIQSFCGEKNVPLVEVPTDQAWDQAVLALLRRGGVVG